MQVYRCDNCGKVFTSHQTKVSIKVGLGDEGKTRTDNRAENDTSSSANPIKVTVRAMPEDMNHDLCDRCLTRAFVMAVESRTDSVGSG